MIIIRSRNFISILSQTYCSSIAIHNVCLQIESVDVNISYEFTANGYCKILLIEIGVIWIPEV